MKNIIIIKKILEIEKLALGEENDIASGFTSRGSI